MLLVTFHGGGSDSAINNVHAYATPDGSKITHKALAEPDSGELSELRSIVPFDGQLYVANGAKKQSTVLAYPLPATLPGSGPLFTNPSVLIGPTLVGKDFTTSIAHPYGITFFSAPGNPVYGYISNQDTNVVGRVSMSDGSLGTGCQSSYLTKSFPGGDFLDGTYVASQNGSLPDVSATTAVGAGYGGLGVTTVQDKTVTDTKTKTKVAHSVRDVAVAGGFLFVCDEVEKVVKLYWLTDGSYLGASAALGQSPTHLAIDNGGLYVSAGSALYWGQLPQSPPSPQAPALNLDQVDVTPPANHSIGGISFDDTSSTVYIPFQAGTGDGQTMGGSIHSFKVSPGDPSKPPKLSKEKEFVKSLDDTPEFVLYWPGP